MASDRPKLLIVEDEPSSIEILCQVLSSACEIYIAKTGAEALRLCTQNNFDVVLMDMELPDTSGVEVCRTLKADEQTQNVPVIFISGFSDLVFEVQAFDAGGVDYLVKPISPVRVLLRINLHLKNKLPLPASI